jgi:hypothetical protein
LVAVVGDNVKECGIYFWGIERKMEDPQVRNLPAPKRHGIDHEW